METKIQLQNYIGHAKIVQGEEKRFFIEYTPPILVAEKVKKASAD